jgi:hypothetical protein
MLDMRVAAHPVRRLISNGPSWSMEQQNDHHSSVPSQTRIKSQ